MTGRFMPFGKYKGMEVDDVPPDYLEWLQEQGTLRDPLKTWIEEYFANAKSSIKKMEDIVLQGLVARGMTEGESRIFLSRLLNLKGYTTKKGIT